VPFVTGTRNIGHTQASPAMAFSTAAATSFVPTGPAGRAMAQPMEPALVEALQQHITLERAASATYFAMAIWFSERELRGFRHFFRQEALSEQEHAAAFADYLIARGQTVVLQDLAAPRQSWSSAEEIMAASFQMEADVTSSLQQLYAMAERAADVRTTTFLDPTIDAQVAAEDQFAHLLGRLRFAQGQPAAILLIDGELSEGQHERGSLG
jgi:ferritin